MIECQSPFDKKRLLKLFDLLEETFYIPTLSVYFRYLLSIQYKIVAQ